MGCHVITTERFQGSFKEFENIGAITFCKNKVEDFVDAINNIINNIDDLKNKKETLHKIAIENYDIRTIVKKLYDSMIEFHKHNF